MIDLSKINTNAPKKTEKKSADRKSVSLSLIKDRFGWKLNDKLKLAFYKELQILVAAGVDSDTRLKIIIEQLSKVEEKQFFEKIRKAHYQGASLSEALEKTGRFTRYEIYSIKIGEEGGSLSEVLAELTSYYEKKIALRRAFLSAISYPSFLFAATIGVLVFMLNFVVPMFIKMFKQFNSNLPFETRLVIKLSDFVGSYWWVMLVGFTLIAIWLSKQKEKVWFRKFTSALVLRIPFFGSLIEKIYLARFCQSMHLLLKSRTLVREALSLTNEMINFYPIEVSLKEVIELYRTGKPLAVSFAKYPIYSSRMVSLIKVGEEVNQLDKIFGDLSKQLSEDVEHQTALISSFIEPIMLLIIGGIVALIMLAIYMPMLDLSNAVLG